MNPYIHAKNNIFLAPLAGITDQAFRQIAAEQGAGLTYTEMVSAKGLKFHNRRTFDLLGVSEAEGRAAVQLFGREPETIARTAAMLEQVMGEKIALFDVNMGCPAPKIVNNGEGSALMKEPKLAGEIICALKKAVKSPVTAKFRKGFDAAHANCVSFAEVLEQAGADGIAVHGRLREQYYEGKADWDAIAEVKRAVRIPVIANGDVFAPEDAQAILRHTGADGVMVARGALGNPQIFGQIRSYLERGTYERPSLSGKVETALRQARLATEQKGEEIAMKEFRKHAAWYVKGIAGAAKLRQRAVSLSSYQELVAFFESLLASADKK